MSSVRSKNTKPELTVRRLLHKAGYRYRLHVKGLPGNPDLVFAGRKKVIFVHGCFWHQHEYCKRSTIPVTRHEWWKEKLSRNVRRDIEAQSKLKDLGWDIKIVWQCELYNLENLENQLNDFLQS